MNHLVDFDALPWASPAKGVRSKTLVRGRQQLRLVEFSYGFEEDGWCYNGHAGYVLEGTFANDFSGTLEHYRAGDVIFIPAGEADRHKAILQPGERVLLLLFEVLEG